jgi:hypothetical protein
MRGYLLGTPFCALVTWFLRVRLAKVPSRRHVICKDAACAYQLSDSSSAGAPRITIHELQAATQQGRLS